MKNFNRINTILNNCGVNILDENNNIKKFNIILRELGEEWNKIAKEKSCHHKYHETNRYLQRVQDGDTLCWVNYKCSLCGDTKTEMS